MKLVFLVVLFCNPIFCFCQNDAKYFNLKVEIKNRGQFILNEAELYYMDNNNQVYKSTPDSTGLINLMLPLENFYTLKIMALGYEQKIVEVNTSVGKIADYNCNFKLSIVLNKTFQGIDYSVLENPLGKISYNKKQRYFEFISNSSITKEIQNLKLKIDSVENISK